MIHDLTITLNEQTRSFEPVGDPKMIYTHRVDHKTFICQASVVTMMTHYGTHVDAPLHYIPEGKTTATLDLSGYVGQGICLTDPAFPKTKAEGEYDITDFLAKNKELFKEGDILLLSTGFEDLLGQDAYFDFPNFANNTGDALAQYGIKGIGMDTPSLTLGNEAHQGVLKHDIGIIESLINLRPLIGKRFFFSAAPLKFEDGDGSPVRAYAITED
jgi:kynurenine formamidase